MSGKQLDPSICNVKVAQGAVVCFEADYVGDITIGTRTVIHPKAKVIAEAGPIIFGMGNLVEEQATIVNKFNNGEDTTVSKTLVIGNNNVFEVGSYCEASAIGDNNVLEAKSKVGSGVELTSGCVIGPLCSINCPQVLSRNTVIQGSDYSRRVQSERPSPQGLQLDFLIKILPNYHRLVKSIRKAQ